MLSRCFHCAKLESMYRNSVYTFGARLQFQYDSCEEIVYFSMDFSTTLIQYIQRNEVTSGQQVLSRCFHCARLESMYRNSVYTFGALFPTAVQKKSTFQWIFELLSFNTSNKPKSHRGNRCYSDAFIVQDLNRSTEIQFTLMGHIFSFSTTAVKR